MDVRVYEHAAIEVHVTTIVKVLAQIPRARAELSLDDGVMFENEPSAASSHKAPPSSNDSDDSDFLEEKDRTKADQYTVRSKGGKNELKLIGEYKPPHKLTMATIRRGFRPMDLSEALNNKDTPAMASSNQKSSGNKRKRLIRQK